jgi:hypothetical protein
LSNEHDNGKTCRKFYRKASNINRLNRIPNKITAQSKTTGPPWKKRKWCCRDLENREISEQRNYADDDDDDLNDLPHPGVERQALHQIKNENDDEECDQDTDQHR